MKVVARHKTAPLVVLSDGSVIDTEDLEVIGNGLVSGAGWDHDVDGLEVDPRWIEIAQAEAANLNVTQKKANTGERTFRAPASVRQSMQDAGVDSAIVDGQGITLQQLDELLDEESLPDDALTWVAGTLNKHEVNPDADEEQSLFDAALPDLDFPSIDAAMDALTAAAPPAAPGDAAPVESAPPGQFNKIVYFALIEQEDTQSVQDLVALVQTQAGAADAFTYEGKKKGWKENAELVAKMQSAAPPPIKELADWQVNSVIDQIDMTASDEPDNPDPDAPVQASGFGFEILESGVIWGPDNKAILSIVAASSASNSAKGHVDGAERLRQYWEHGKGAEKIKWAPNSGSWRRCVRHLSRYLGPEKSKGYCAIRMHHVLGIWPGSEANGGHGGGHHKI